MKKHLIIAFLAAPLYAASPKALPPIPNGPPLQSLLDQHSHVRAIRQLKKAGTAGAVTAGAYALSRTDVVHQLFPELFPRSGTSYAIMGIIGVVAGSGGIWVLRDKLEEWGLRQKATEDMLKSSEILEQLLPVIKEVQANQTELEKDMATWGPKVDEALTNSIKVREGYEAVLASVETIVGDMGDDKTALGQITVLKDQIDGIQLGLMKVLQDLGETTTLANDNALAHLRTQAAEAPSIDALTEMANELESASKRFAQTPAKVDPPTARQRHRRVWKPW